MNNRKCWKSTKKKFVFLEKQQRIIKMAINKISKTQHAFTEIK